MATTQPNVVIKDGETTPVQKSIAAYSADAGVTLVPAHAAVDATMTLINPATAEGIASLLAALTALLGYNDGIEALLTSILTAAGTNPTGASTAALQTTGNTAISGLHTDLLALIAALRPVYGKIALTNNTDATAGRYFYANCTVAGTVTVTLSDATTESLTLVTGPNVFNMEVTKYVIGTATATCSNWK